MSLSSFRSLLYRLARLLDDVQAVKKGRVVKRVERRIVGRWTSRVQMKRLPDFRFDAKKKLGCLEGSTP